MNKFLNSRQFRNTGQQVSFSFGNDTARPSCRSSDDDDDDDPAGNYLNSLPYQ